MDKIWYTHTITLTPASANDTFIRDSAPTTNYSLGTGFTVGAATAVIQRSLIKFDLSFLEDTDRIVAATLNLYLTAEQSSNARTMRIYRLKKLYVVSEVTWNIYSTGNNWTTAGGFNVADCEQTDIGSIVFSATETTNATKSIPIVGALKSDLDLGFGWLLKMDTEVDDRYDFASSRHATEAYRPSLVITYKSRNP